MWTSKFQNYYLEEKYFFKAIEVLHIKVVAVIVKNAKCAINKAFTCVA